MTAETFPSGFPDDLAAAAFLTGSEAAWPPQVASKVVEWLGQNKFAVLGTEIWTVHKDGAITPSIEGGLYGNAVSNKGNESWGAYVCRAADDALRCIESANLSMEAKEQKNVFFNITWVNESEYSDLRGPNAR